MDGNGMSVYVNGAEVAGPVAALTWASGGDMRFGASWSDSSKCLNASFDDIAGYTPALSAAQILAHYVP